MRNPGVLIVEDDPNLREALCATLKLADHPVLEAGNGHEALEVLGHESVGLVISDVQMEPMDGNRLLEQIHQRYPGLPAVLMTAFGTIEKAVDAMRDGAADYLVKPFEADELINTVNRYLQNDNDTGDLIVADRKSRELAGIARRVADSEATVMLSGESGTGKEVIARYIHAHSPRAKQAFVAINCAAIPENMLEAVLFGYEKGAFTGATSASSGKFEQAQGGTLLLDEVSEMDISLQAKLLRVLQEREVERLGGRKTISLDVRVLATTNRDLRQYVADGRFREDLYYRLNVFPLQIPALRERPADVMPLVRHAIARFGDASRGLPKLTKPATQRLKAHQWPGNVRELENLIQRSLIMLRGDRIDASDLIFEQELTATDTTSTQSILAQENIGAGATDAPLEKETPRPGGAAVAASSSDAPLQSDLKKLEMELIVSALRESNGNRKAAAATLGISARTLRYKMARLRDAGIALPAVAGTDVA